MIENNNETEILETQKKKSKIGLIIGAVIVLIILILIGLLYRNNYYYSDNCGVRNVEAAADELEGFTEEWDDAFEIATSTSRISLAGPVAVLQEIKRNTADVEVKW